MISKGRKDYISYLHWGKGMTLRSLLLMKTLSTCAKKKKKANETYQFKVNGIKGKKVKLMESTILKLTVYQAVPTKIMN